MGSYRVIRFWKITGIKMRWSLEAWMEYRGNNFSWNCMHKNKMIQYIKLVNIILLFLKRCLVYSNLTYVKCFSHALIIFSSFWNVCYPMLYFCNWYRCDHSKSKELVIISYLGDTLLCTTSQYFSTFLFNVLKIFFPG